MFKYFNIFNKNRNFIYKLYSGKLEFIKKSNRKINNVIGKFTKNNKAQKLLIELKFERSVAEGADQRCKNCHGSVQNRFSS